MFNSVYELLRGLFIHLLFKGFGVGNSHEYWEQQKLKKIIQSRVANLKMFSCQYQFKLLDFGIFINY